MPEQAPTLRDMIEKAIANGRTLRELEARAIDEQGNTIGKDTIRKIRHGLVDRMPLERNLRAIAAALEVPYERVRQAAIAEWVPPDAPSTAADIPDDRRAQLIADAQRLHDLTGRILAEEQDTTDAAERGGAA
jgi:hypothetical protein